ncbi:N-acetylgalactosamine-6-phosphate deacetylase [bioreactor metagenome]|uniref:N-acetylgalactosamine-6-phosphate deacetylase n=1 Tax=bioreactor metagenome TaxID=1076179 RepID=A0A645DFU9_9ZZZZ
MAGNQPVEHCLDFGNARIIPGIIDTHNHGKQGYYLYLNVTDSPQEKLRTVENYLQTNAEDGVTGILPTAKLPYFNAIYECSRSNPRGSKILGIHSEGPWLNRVGEKGRPRPYPTVSLDYLREMITEAHGLLKVVGLAPEIPGIDIIMEELKANHIDISFAHSDCNYEQTLAAIEKGINTATHLSNVMTGLHHRDIGGTGALLTSDKVYCEIICDGLHVSLPYLKIILQVKDSTHLLMISDSSSLAGAPVGAYRSPAGDVQVFVDEQGFIKDSDGRINGSSKPVLYGIGNLVEKLQIPMEKVLRMASLTPAQKYGYGDCKGSIKIGKDADFVVITDDYKAVKTFVEGKEVYDQKDSKVGFNPHYYESLDGIER